MGGILSSIVRSFEMLQDKRLISHSMTQNIVGMGNSMYFWKEIWIGNEKLMHLFQGFILWIFNKIVLFWLMIKGEIGAEMLDLVWKLSCSLVCLSY